MNETKTRTKVNEMTKSCSTLFQSLESIAISFELLQWIEYGHTSISHFDQSVILSHVTEHIKHT